VLGVFLFVCLLVGYQLVITFLSPPWADEVTGWFRMVLAWPQAIPLVLLSWWLTRARRPEAPAWWLLTASMLGYAIGKTLLVTFEQFKFRQGVPFPWWSDFFYLITLPCFFLAPMLWPGVLAHHQHGLARMKLFLDTLLVMGAVTALFWYFFLAPLFMRSMATPLTKVVWLAYPIMDLGGCFALTVILTRQGWRLTQSAVLRLLLVSAACLIIADSWIVWLHLYTPSQSGTFPDLFFLIASLLVPLAGLVQFRLARTSSALAEPPVTQGRLNPRHQDLMNCFRFLLPFGLVLLAGAAIEARILTDPVRASGEVVPHLIILALLLLVLVRQGVAFLEYAHVQREREEARANEQAMRETYRQMETFLGVVSHELKTPLSVMLLSLQALQRRLKSLTRPETGLEKRGTAGGEALQSSLELTWQQFGRLNRLVNDLVDTSRIHAGRLECHFQQADLAAIVAQVVEEQRRATPGRTVLFFHKDESPIPAWCDPARIGQVVTNFLTNALKYSHEERSVEVGIQREGQQGYVWVRDQGPGIPESARAHLWERFYRVPGIEVQSGSGVGLGLGLYISKMIIAHHHGQVGVESVPGQGSTFWFMLPLVKPEERVHIQCQAFSEGKTRAGS
jgi:signal transduction histidine kinase